MSGALPKALPLGRWGEPAGKVRAFAINKHTVGIGVVEQTFGFVDELCHGFHAVAEGIGSGRITALAQLPRLE